MRVLYVCSEILPLVKTGGLANVASSYTKALRNHGVDQRILLPGYTNAIDALSGPRRYLRARIDGGTDVRIVEGRTPDSRVPVWLIDCPDLYQRAGGPYQDETGRDWHDNAKRFSILSAVAAAIGRGRCTSGWTPDVVHLNDWHTGLAAALLASDRGRGSRTLFTVHNLAYQGNFPSESLADIALDPEQTGLVMRNGRVSLLEMGLRFSDLITTVSPTYAAEILTPQYGFGMEDVLRHRRQRLYGILNGIDCDVWNPATDQHLSNCFDRNALGGKRMCKIALQNELGLDADAHRPLITFTSRFVHQKMIDVLIDVIPAFVARGAQLAIVGEGERGYTNALEHLAARYPGEVAVRTPFDEVLEHRLHAGGDMLLAPARFEPCGLTQMYAMRYGSLPVARRVGGLNDTVSDATPHAIEAGTATGFVFSDPTAEDLLKAVDRALSVFRQPDAWRQIQRTAMERDFSWMRSMKMYLRLYALLARADRSPAPNIAETPGVVAVEQWL